MDGSHSLKDNETGSVFPSNSSLVSPPLAALFGKDITVTLYVLTLIAISLIGTVGNLLIIGALLVHKQLRTLGNVFIGNLAICDLSVSMFIIPLALAGVFHPDFFIRHRTVCEIISHLWLFSLNGSYLSIPAIAVNRYIAICYGTLYPKIYNKKLIVLNMVIFWAVCATFLPPNIFGYSLRVDAFNTKIYSCSAYSFSFLYTANLPFLIYFLIAGVCFPVVMIFISYCHIFIFAKRSKRRLERFSISQQPVIKSSDIRVLKSISIIMMFVLLWSPFMVVMLLDVSDTSWPRWSYLLATVLIFTNSSINSIVYAASNPSFREGYVLFVKKVCACMFGQSLKPQYPPVSA